MSTTTELSAAELATLTAQIEAAQRLLAAHKRQQAEATKLTPESITALRAVKTQLTPMPTTTEHRGLAGYVRISDDRAGAGLGVERQRADVAPLALELFPGRIFHLYVDNDLSASGKVKRPAYEQMLADMEAGKVHAVLAWHPDRLHRSPAQLERFISLVEAHQVAVHTAKAGELDLSTPSGRLVARMLGSIAKYELEHQVERQEAKQVELAKAGKPGGGPRLFGYTSGFRLDPETGTCVVESEAVALQAVVAQVLAGASLRSQAAWLNDQGLVGTRGKPFANSNLRALLLRPALAGLRVYRAGKPDEQTFPATWPALITQDQHSALVARLCAPERMKGKGHGTRRHLLSGIASCGTCGGSMQAATEAAGKGRARYGIYRCRKGFCVNRGMERVDAIAIELVGAWLAKQSPTGLLTDPQTDATQKLLTAKVTKAQRKLARIEADYDEGHLDGAEYRAKKDPAKAELAKAEQENIAHQQPATVLDGLLGQPDAVELLKGLPLSRRRAVIAAVGTPVVHPGHRHMADFSVVTMKWAEWVA